MAIQIRRAASRSRDPRVAPRALFEALAIASILMANRVVGFATYGEQFNGKHVNQTFTGVALTAR